MSREYPCVYYDNERCKKFSGDKCTSWCVLGPCGEQTLSNADRIRAMSDEELSVFLWSLDVDDITMEEDGTAFLRRNLTKWLKQPAKEDA